MTDSDSLRGDDHAPPDNNPELHELATLRALLRPRMADVGDPTPTEALRGMFIEIERLRDREGRRRPMDEAIIADNENAIARLTSELAAERKMARAAGDGHDHAHTLLETIASVFGRVDDFDTLPAKVKELDEYWQPGGEVDQLKRKAERLQDRVDNLEKERLVRAAETASERKQLEQRIDEMKQALATAAEKRAALEDRLSREIAKTREMVGAQDQAQLPARPSTARCPVCHRTAAVKAGCFQQHMSGDRICAGSAHCPESDRVIRARLDELAEQNTALGEALNDASAQAKACRAALIIMGWNGEDGHPEAWAQETAAGREKLLSTLISGHDAAGKFKQELEAELRRVGVTDYERDIVRRIGEAFASESDSRRSLNEHIDVLQAELGVHAATIEACESALHTLGWSEGDPEAWAKGFAGSHAQRTLEASGSAVQALVRLGWRDGSPVEWAKSKAVEIEALVGRINTFRSWVLGFCPAGTLSTSATDEELRACMTFVPATEHERAIKAIKDEAFALRVQIDSQQHALAELNRELRIAGEWRFNVEAARRGEAEAFYEALSPLWPIWPGWSPCNISSPISMFRDVVAEIQKRQPGQSLSP